MHTLVTGRAVGDEGFAACWAHPAGAILARLALAGARLHICNVREDCAHIPTIYLNIALAIREHSPNQENGDESIEHENAHIGSLRTPVLE
jgi:hypothetical protein